MGMKFQVIQKLNGKIVHQTENKQSAVKLARTSRHLMVLDTETGKLISGPPGRPRRYPFTRQQTTVQVHAEDREIILRLARLANEARLDPDSPAATQWQHICKEM